MANIYQRRKAGRLSSFFDAFVRNLEKLRSLSMLGVVPERDFECKLLLPADQNALHIAVVFAPDVENVEESAPSLLKVRVAMNDYPSVGPQIGVAEAHSFYEGCRA